MDDILLLVANMSARRNQLLRIRDMTHNPEIKEAVLKVVSEIEADIQRLEADAGSNAIHPEVAPPQA